MRIGILGSGLMGGKLGTIFARHNSRTRETMGLRSRTASRGSESRCRPGARGVVVRRRFYSEITLCCKLLKTEEQISWLGVRDDFPQLAHLCRVSIESSGRAIRQVTRRAGVS
jgi:hypothetical protein